MPLKITSDDIDYLRKVMHKMVWDTSEHEDIVQDALLKAVTSKYRGNCSVKTWLCRMARQVIIDRYRDRKSMKRTRTAEFQQTTVNTNPLARFELAEVEKSVAKLDPLSAQIFWQNAQGMTKSEIAELHGMTLSAAHARISRARKAVLRDLA